MSLPRAAKAALQQAEAEGLTLLKANSPSGYTAVYVDKRRLNKPYKMQVQRGGKLVHPSAPSSRPRRRRYAMRARPRDRRLRRQQQQRRQLLRR